MDGKRESWVAFGKKPISHGIIFPIRLAKLASTSSLTSVDSMSYAMRRRKSVSKYLSKQCFVLVQYISNNVLLVECTWRLWCICYWCFGCRCGRFCGKFRSLRPARCRFCTGCWSFAKICSHCYQKNCCFKTGKSLYVLIMPYLIICNIGIPGS